MLTLLGKKLEILNSESSPDLIEAFLQSRNLSQEELDMNSFHDPYSLPDIGQAIARIESARKRGERVMIFGDYDVDGVSSTALLYLYLREELGMEVSYRIPHRVTDGYGLREKIVDEIASTNTTLIITVDTGTRDEEAIKKATELGIDVIITDHHSCPETLPRCIAVINPKRKDSLYPFSSLSGSGVVFKLIQALTLHFFPEKISEIEKKYIDLASLGTIADCMPMIGENRTIVKRGIQSMQHPHRAFFRTLSKSFQKAIVTEEDIGFFVGPLLNASGRIGSALTSLKALLSRDQDAHTNITKLMQLNEERKLLTSTAFQKALSQIDGKEAMLFYFDPELSHGIIGLVASKLCEQYHRPVGAFTAHEPNMLVGSFRSPNGVNIMDILNHAKSHIHRFGGHANAAGCQILETQFLNACELMKEKADSLRIQECIPSIAVDAMVSFDHFTIETIEAFESLRPFGPGFLAPKFVLSGVNLPVSGLGSSGEHIKWEHPKFDILGFHLALHEEKLRGQDVSLIGRFTINTWQNRKKIQFLVEDVAFSL